MEVESRGRRLSRQVQCFILNNKTLGCKAFLIWQIRWIVEAAAEEETRLSLAHH